MNSFHQSRGRIAFEAFAAFGLAASFLAAWMELGVAAFLAAAAISALLGVVRLSDLRGRRQQPVLAIPAEENVIHVDSTAVPEPALIDEPAVRDVVEEPDLVVQEVKKPARARKTKPAAAKAAVLKTVEIAPPAIVEIHVEVADELDHAPVTPLFEAEPFVRQQRTVFGRKAG